MLRNYLLIAWRNLKRHPAFSFINLSGLAIGMFACLLILQYVGFELSYDSFHENRSRIYRIRNDRYREDEVIQRGVVTYPMVPVAIQRDYPEVQDYVRIAPWIADHTLIKYGNHVFREKGLLFAEPAFFKLFSFPLLQGNPRTALLHPMSIVLTRSRAAEIFGSEDPMGKTVTFEANKPFTVTGIMEDIPANSHLSCTMLVSYSTLSHWMPDYANSWTFAEEVYGYLLLRPGADAKALQAKLTGFSRLYYPGSRLTGTKERFLLQPLGDIHLHSHFQFELGRNGNAAATWGLLGVAILIMVIAWSNYLNLSTARYAERAREIGIRKIAGAGKKQLLTQFLVESLSVAGLGFLLALTLFEVLDPIYCRFLGLEGMLGHSIQLFGLPFWAYGCWLFAFGAVLSGIYPALILPSFRPIAILKGNQEPGSAAVWVRKSLVIYQFAVTIALMAFTWVVYQQTRFMMQKELGVNIEGTMVVWGPMGIEWTPALETRMATFEHEVQQLPSVKAVSSSKNVPGDQLEKIPLVQVEGKTERFTLVSTWVSSGYFHLYGMQLLAGRPFSDKQASDGVVINQSAVKRLGFASNEASIGKKIRLWDQEKAIVGVVNDHHQQSLHHLVEPMVYWHGSGQDGYFSIKLRSENLSQTISQVKAIYGDLFQGTSFQYFFLENYFDEQYQTEHRLLPLITAFSALAILISCLGLWGLVLHAFSLRRREIGIRKVLGAGVVHLVTLLSKDSLQSVLIAFGLALPLAWWAIGFWLSDFAYRVEWNGWILIGAGGLALLIALLTVATQAWKAARQNPVKALRSE